MAHAVRGLLLLSVYSGGFSAVCPICHFNASVRRFNVCGYPLIPPPSCLPCGRCLWPYGVAVSSAPWLAALAVRCQFAAALVPLWPCRRLYPAPAVRSRCPGASGGCFAVRGSPPKSPGKSRKSLAKSQAPAPKSLILPQNHSRLQNSVYKGGIFLAHFPKVNGESCKSRSISAHFASKSLASMYFCWSCSGVKPSICGWFGVKTISCLSTMP